MPKNTDRAWGELASSSSPEIPPEAPAPEVKAEAVEPEAKKEDAAPAAPDEPTMTVDAFSRRCLKKDALAIAFISGEKRVSGVRKLAETEWRKLYDAFLNAPR